jgi:hypothetical protein
LLRISILPFLPCLGPHTLFLSSPPPDWGSPIIKLIRYILLLLPLLPFTSVQATSLHHLASDSAFLLTRLWLKQTRYAQTIKKTEGPPFGRGLPCAVTLWGKRSPNFLGSFSCSYLVLLLGRPSLPPRSRHLTALSIPPPTLKKGPRGLLVVYLQ